MQLGRDAVPTPPVFVIHLSTFAQAVGRFAPLHCLRNSSVLRTPNSVLWSHLSTFAPELRSVLHLRTVFASFRPPHSVLCPLPSPFHFCTGRRPICTFAPSRPRSPLQHITQPELMIPIGASAERELVAEINQAGADFPLRAESNIQGVFW